MLEFEFRRCVEELRLMGSNLRVWNALIDMREFMCGGWVLTNGKVLLKKCVALWCFVGARKLTVDHGAGCVNAKWLNGTPCGACAMGVELW